MDTMWFVSKKKYESLANENAILKQQLEHYKIQVGAIALLYCEELDSWKERSRAIEDTNKIIEEKKQEEIKKCH